MKDKALATTMADTEKQRLEHIDVMRPIKQLGVVANHSLIFFAPAASLMAASSVLLLHATREAFLFISACMLMYAYPMIKRRDLGRYYWRRFLSVGVPYVCWTLIYFILSFKTTQFSWGIALKSLAYDLSTGYYQLYFLVLLMQFYVVFPLLQRAVVRLRNHHVRLMVISLLVQVVYISLMHWNLLPYWLRGNWANRELMPYQFYILGGMVAAYNFNAFHQWIVQHAKFILCGTLFTAVLAVSWVIIEGVGHISGMGYESDPFQPIAIPFNIGAILSVYLFGLWLVQHIKRGWVKGLVSSGISNSYGIYMAQLVFLNGLLWLGFGSANLLWPLKILGAVIISYGGSWLLTALLARTPLAKALTGRKQVPWSSILPEAWRRNVPKTETVLAE